MANTTRLTLLGPPAWRRGADGAALPWLRPTALLAIIACHPSGIGRDALAGLIRPDADEATAHAPAAQPVIVLRALLPADAALHADGHRLRWRGACDVVEFLAAIDGTRLETCDRAARRTAARRHRRVR